FVSDQYHLDGRVTADLRGGTHRLERCERSTRGVDDDAGRRSHASVYRLAATLRKSTSNCAGQSAPGEAESVPPSASATQAASGPSRKKRCSTRTPRTGPALSTTRLMGMLSGQPEVPARFFSPWMHADRRGERSCRK